MMIQDDFSPADSVNALALQLRGGITGDGEYGNIEIQIYRSDDSDDSVEDQPSTTHRLEGVTADFSDVYINLREDDQEVNNIRKIQILYIANGRSCQLELRNIRFEPHDFTIRPDAPVAPPEIPVTSSINPRIEAGFQNVCGFGYLGRTCELQFYANGLIPLRSWQGQRLTREINTLSLTAGEQVDTLEDVFGNPHTSEVTYLGLQYDLGWGSRDNRYSLTLRTDFGIGPFPLETLQPQFNDQALLRAEAYFWSQYAEAGFSAKIHHRYRGLDTYHFSAHGSLASVNPPYSNLRIGITGDHYYFPYMGRFQERWQGGFDFRYDLPIQLGRRARLTLRADLSPYAFITRTPDGNTWGAGIRAGIRALLDLPRGFGLELRYYYQTDATIGQPNTRFEQHDIEALLTYEF